MTQPSHTPTPWKYEKSLAGSKQIFGADGIVVFKEALCRRKEENEANAAYIVKCVNGYDPLLEAYQDLIVWRNKQVGTPCEQIRHQQLVAELVEALNCAYTEIERAMKYGSVMAKQANPRLTAIKAALKKAGAE